MKLRTPPHAYEHTICYQPSRARSQVSLNRPAHPFEVRLRPRSFPRRNDLLSIAALLYIARSPLRSSASPPGKCRTFALRDDHGADDSPLAPSNL
jgi:hypothetical protein